jgi:GDP-mannose 6-dehydrogenase
VVFRSTMLPGSMDEVIIPALERTSGLRAGQDFGVGYYPEFLRESSAIADYDAPGAVVFGSIDERTLKAMHALQPGLKVTPHEVDLKGAEIIKYVNNAWHAAKISFSNEVGNICRAIGVDSHQVMRIVCSDTRLNISPAYMMPGFAYGGSCLPKDLRALRYRAKMLDVPTPVLDGVVAANTVQLDRAFRLVEQSGARKVGLVGLSFKADTDDLRESPLVILAETLIGKGYELKIYDPNIRLSRLTGSNLAYVQQRMPHIAALLTEKLDDVVEHAGVLVLAQKKLGVEAMASPKLGGTPVIDLIRVDPALTSRNAYEGLSW